MVQCGHWICDLQNLNTILCMVVRGVWNCDSSQERAGPAAITTPLGFFKSQILLLSIVWLQCWERSGCKWVPWKVHFHLCGTINYGCKQHSTINQRVASTYNCQCTIYSKTWFSSFTKHRTIQDMILDKNIVKGTTDSRHCWVIKHYWILKVNWWLCLSYFNLVWQIHVSTNARTLLESSHARVTSVKCQHEQNHSI